jgi:hypothetical protein
LVELDDVRVLVGDERPQPVPVVVQLRERRRGHGEEVHRPVRNDGREAVRVVGHVRDHDLGDAVGHAEHGLDAGARRLALDGGAPREVLEAAMEVDPEVRRLHRAPAQRRVESLRERRGRQQQRGRHRDRAKRLGRDGARAAAHARRTV